MVTPPLRYTPAVYSSATRTRKAERGICARLASPRSNDGCDAWSIRRHTEEYEHSRSKRTTYGKPRLQPHLIISDQDTMHRSYKDLRFILQQYQSWILQISILDLPIGGLIVRFTSRFRTTFHSKPFDIHATLTVWNADRSRQRGRTQWSSAQEWGRHCSCSALRWTAIGADGRNSRPLRRESAGDHHCPTTEWAKSPAKRENRRMWQ